MAVTTANTIKFSDVCLEIWGSSSTAGRTLTGAFAAATGTFNPTYAVSGANTLLDFRGCNHSAGYYIHQFHSSTSATSAITCGYIHNSLKYTNAPVLDVGDIVYNDSALTSPFNGLSRWWHLAEYSARINSSGVILDLTPCL